MIKPHDMTVAASVQPETTPRHLRAELRTPGVLAKWPFIGLIMILLGMCLFGTLAISVQTHSPLLQTDTQIVNALHVTALRSSPLVVGVMIFGFYVGEQVIVVIGGVLVVYFLLKRFWSELTMVVIAWGGEGGIWTVLTQDFNRARPVFDVPVWHQMTSPGFPSGHSFATVLCFGLLAYLLVPKMPSRSWKVMVIAIALLTTLYVGFSRIFIGDHYPTDILAGYALGIAWGGLVYTTVELTAQSRRKKREARRTLSSDFNKHQRTDAPSTGRISDL